MNSPKLLLSSIVKLDGQSSLDRGSRFLLELRFPNPLYLMVFVIMLRNIVHFVASIDAISTPFFTSAGNGNHTHVCVIQTFVFHPNEWTTPCQQRTGRCSYRHRCPPARPSSPAPSRPPRDRSCTRSSPATPSAAARSGTVRLPARRAAGRHRVDAGA